MERKWYVQRLFIESYTTKTKMAIDRFFYYIAPCKGRQGSLGFWIPVFASVTWILNSNRQWHGIPLLWANYKSFVVHF